MHKIRVILFLLVSFNTFSQIEEVRRITKALCSPEFHGRGYVNKGDSIAAEFIKIEFQRLGVKPYIKSYFQHFNLDVNTFPKEMEIYHQGNLLKAGHDFSINPNYVGRKGRLKLYEINAKDALKLNNIPSIITSIIQKKFSLPMQLLMECLKILVSTLLIF